MDDTPPLIAAGKGLPALPFHLYLWLVRRDDVPFGMPPEFQEFIAVDWSGAKGPRLRGLQVASCRPGNGAPKLIRRPPSWTRTGVMEYAVARAKKNGPVLAGFDFGFAYPFDDCDTSFPGLDLRPPDAVSLWALIESLSGDAPDLYGGLAAQPPSPIAPFFNVHHNRGRWFSNRRLRLTERLCPTRPSCMFNGVGPASVGVGSLAGMRLLHHLKQRRDVRVAVWPFDAVDDADLVVVEIFPRLYARTTSMNPRAPLTEDEYDALISADALRSLSASPQVWDHKGNEGWIFGVATSRTRTASDR